MAKDDKYYTITLKVPDWKDDDELDAMVDKVYELSTQSRLEHVQDILDGPIACGRVGYFAWLVDCDEENLEKWTQDLVKEVSGVFPGATLAQVESESNCT